MPPNPKSARFFLARDALDQLCRKAKINGNARKAFVENLRAWIKETEDMTELREKILASTQALDLDKEPILQEFIAAYRDSPAFSKQ